MGPYPGILGKSSGFIEILPYGRWVMPGISAKSSWFMKSNFDLMERYLPTSRVNKSFNFIVLAWRDNFDVFWVGFDLNGGI